MFYTYRQTIRDLAIFIHNFEMDDRLERIKVVQLYKMGNIIKLQIDPIDNLVSMLSSKLYVCTFFLIVFIGWLLKKDDSNPFGNEIDRLLPQ